MAKHVAERPRTIPDESTINRLQARRLARSTGLPEQEFADQTVVALRERLQWVVDPRLWFFELICGQVVKIDPVTGLKYPVPGATVDVLDVDCDWLWYFPVDWPWSWAFPFGPCEVETLATTTTDACGNFCVWVPRFDIDWVLEWRRARICLPEIFKRPSIADIVERLGPMVEGPRFPVNPNPPDPAPLLHLLRERPDFVSAIGSGTADRLAALASVRSLGGDTDELRSLLAGPAFSRPVPPPVGHELKQLHARAEHAELSARLGIERPDVQKLQFDEWRGPYLRCFDIEVPEWVPFFEVPDITFRVTQDIDGDGDQELIYDGAFDGPWGWSTHVELDAAPWALALPSPGCGPDFPCADTPALQMIGVMPIEPGYISPASGFAIRPNPARASGHQTVGAATYPSTAPFEGTLLLYGCAHGIANADHYRILAEFAPGDGLGAPLVFGGPQPLVEHWHMFHFNPFQDVVQQPVNTDGWYPLLDDSWDPVHLLMNWNPDAMGTYRLTLELGRMLGGTISLVAAAPAVNFFVDNTYPSVDLTIVQWREHPAGPWHPLPAVCPLIERTPGTDVDVQVIVNVTAAHLRGVVISAGGCGGASPSPATVDHWHASELDNSFSTSTIYTVPAAAPAGCYGWSVDASGRAFNPDGEFNALNNNFYYDPLFIHVVPSRSVAIVNKP